MEFVDSDKDGYLSFDEYKGKGNLLEYSLKFVAWFT